MMFPVMVALSFKVWLELSFCKKNMAGWHDVRFRRYQLLLRRGFFRPLTLDMLVKIVFCIRRGFFPKTFSFTNIHFMLCKIFQIDF